MGNKFAKGDIVKSKKQDNIFYIVDEEVQGKYGIDVVCFRLDDKYVYTIPKQDLEFWFNVSMMG